MRPALALLALCACGGRTRASGDLGGERVSAQDAYYTVEEAAWPDSDRVRVFLAGYGDACATRAAYLDDLEGDVTPDDLAASWAAAMPREFWWIELDVRLDDFAAPSGDYAGQPWDDGLTASGQAQVSLTHYLQPLDVRYWDSSADDAEYVERYLGDGGALTLDDGDDALSGRLEAPAVDFEGAPAGDVVVAFEAERCEAVEGR